MFTMDMQFASAAHFANGARVMRGDEFPLDFIAAFARRSADHEDNASLSMFNPKERP
jgi:hypothetical protein